MSTHLKWYPPPKDKDEDRQYISYLKYDLADRLGERNGSEVENLGFVDKKIIPFLEGIIAGDKEGKKAENAKTLIDAIIQYGKVELIIEA